jgi:alpha-galactosidase
MSFINLAQQPDHVTAFCESGEIGLEERGGKWSAGGVEVSYVVNAFGGSVHIAAPSEKLQRVRLRWHGSFQQDAKFLGDHWERGYGDLEWRGFVAERVLPWYVLAHEPEGTHGFGVRTGPSSMCFWQTDPSGITLWLDVRNGGTGIDLGDRRLDAATVVCRKGMSGESPFEAARAFCEMMCPNPLMPDHPVYGGNNWYYAYGKSSHEQILLDTDLLVSLSLESRNRPYMVIDAGWTPEGSCLGSEWDRGNQDFPDMAKLAVEMRSRGARPGLWVRPLAMAASGKDNWLLRTVADGIRVLDPSIPEALEHVKLVIARIRAWGYDLIKHDFSTFDLFNRWGSAMGPDLTSSDWSFSDRTRTTAEIVLDLYRTIREAAGGAVVIGCNTIGHLAAGLVEIQRTGDDTSGNVWERTRKMGINTLAFRAAQHGTFFAVDADCVGLTKHIPWEKNRQWLDLLSRSGTPLFVSADPLATGPEQAAALREAFAIAAEQQPLGEPLDWLNSTSPRQWKLQGERRDYDWLEPGGALPFFFA